MDEVIAFDTETTVDSTQRFLFGSFRYAVVYKGRLSVLEEGIIYADDLPQYDPAGYQQLVEYAAHNRADVDLRFTGPREPTWRISLLSRSQWAERWLWRIAYQRQAAVVGFNLPFDLSRLAIDVTDARPPYADGFSFAMWKYGMRPNLRIKHVSNKKSFISWTLGKTPDSAAFRGRFVDLRTATFALTNGSHSLESACLAFGAARQKQPVTQHGVISPEYIDYNRSDVAATVALYDKVREELARHPIDLPLERAYSPASIAKAYYAALGVVPPLEKYAVSDEVMGYVMSAFYGGRSECVVRKTRVPVALVDFTSMYPTVNALMQLWYLLTARQVDTYDSTTEVRQLLSQIDADACFDPSIWTQFRGIARIKPNRDVLPVRARYGSESTYGIGVNEVSSDEELWYAIPDLVASTLLTGKPPHVIEALSFRPVGTQSGLRQVALRGELMIEPHGEDFFRWAVEQRQRVRASNGPLGDFLKVMANSGSYGIFAEMNRDDSISESDVTVHSAGSSSWRTRVRHPERPGRWAYPPIAACITAAARLMLALLEHEVVRAGGCWAMCDTDSMAIVTADGGWSHPDIPALPFRAVQRIVERFDKLSPYDPAVVPHLLKVEFRGEFYGISAKRYALVTGAEIAKHSEHGLGHLRGPRAGWMRDIWESVVSGTAVPFSGQPAVAQWTVSTPSLYHTLRYWNEGRPYVDQIKPFNFLTVAYVRRQHKPRLPSGVKGFQLITPYLSSPSDAMTATWVNKYDPWSAYRITTELRLMDDAITVVTYGDVINDYRIHPESKFVAWDGSPSTPNTVGRLRRMHVRLAGLDYIGKEANRVEETQLGLIDGTQLKVTTSDQRWDQMRIGIFEVLSRYRAVENARLLGVSVSEYRRIESGRVRPHNLTRDKFIHMAVHIACGDLHRSPNLIKDPRTLITEWRYSRMGGPNG